jgi:hypothetical protein
MLSHGDSSDPLGTLAIVLGQVVELLFYKGIIKPADNSSSTTKKCCAHALMALGEIIRLAKGLKDQHISKVSQSCVYVKSRARIMSMCHVLINYNVQVHPMMPMSLFFAAEFLYENRKLGNSVFLAQLRPMIEALGNLRNVNNHEKSYLDLLPHSCISASLGVLEHSKQ